MVETTLKWMTQILSMGPTYHYIRCLLDAHSGQSLLVDSMYNTLLIRWRDIGIIYQLRMLGINFERTSTILCDNEGVVMNTQRPTSNLKKKHNAVAYHRIREMISIGLARTAHVGTKLNISDIETKAQGPASYYQLLSFPLYGRSPEEDSSVMDWFTAQSKGSCRE